MIRIITDFDGPISDVSERYYRVYLLSLEKNRRQNQQIRVLSKEEFWGLKRSRTPEKQIGIMSGLEETQAENFALFRKQNVPTQPYFEYDILANAALQALLKAKPLLMERALKELPPVKESWMVGDTEADITAAKKHDVKSIAVECGIRDRNQLESYGPDYFVKNVTEAVNLILGG